MPFRNGKGSRAALEGAPRECKGVSREHGGALGEHWGVVSEQGGGSKRAKVLAPQELNLAALYPAIAAPIIYPTILLGLPAAA